jgi:ferric-dicitrate binding protein FerR (iron transport regulator)
MNPPFHIRELVFRYNWNELKPKDARKLLRWREQSPANELYFQYETGTEQRKAVAERAEAAKDRILARLLNHLENPEGRRRGIRVLLQNKWRRLAAIVVVSAGLISVLNIDIGPTQPKPRTGDQGLSASFIDGQGLSHPLDDMRRGWRDGRRNAQEARRRQMKFPLFTAPATDPRGSPDRYNTLTTFGHSRYQLLLPDGSRTWQNLNSSVAYPANYSSDALKLRISGEVYLEITSNKAVRTPFFIQAGKVQIEAHTGRLNLRAYPGEAEISLSAIDGALIVRNSADTSSRPITLSPGQQLILRGNQVEIKKSFDLLEVLRWKKEL